jgi:hypothetical protein
VRWRGAGWDSIYQRLGIEWMHAYERGALEYRVPWSSGSRGLGREWVSDVTTILGMFADGLLFPSRSMQFFTSFSFPLSSERYLGHLHFLCFCCERYITADVFTVLSKPIVDTVPLNSPLLSQPTLLVTPRSIFIISSPLPSLSEFSLLLFYLRITQYTSISARFG